MERIIRFSLTLAVCTAAYVCVAIPYLQLPYNQVSLPTTILNLSLLVVFGGAWFLRAYGNSLLASWIVVGAMVPLVICARITIETSQDPTSHNLWPLEVIIAAGVGFLVSGFGALVGSLYRRIARNGRQAA